LADLNSLAIFAKVAEANSFTEAARRLKMPISTAELETELGVRLLERSTRHLRLTDLGTQLLQQAQASAELSEAVDKIVTNRLSDVSGVLRISSPPSISDSLLAPIVGAYQEAYPQVRVQIFIADRYVDLMAEGVDLSFIVGRLQDATLVARTILSYRHRLLASPEYFDDKRKPTTPEDLLAHRLLAFSFWEPQNNWDFVHVSGKETKTLAFRPFLSVNDYIGLVPALLAGVGIGEMPPIVKPELVRDGLLVEVMPKWRFRPFELKIVHLGNRYIPRPVRLFIEIAERVAPTLFPKLPN
jgi:DNA-binding transcriptional LysR family regulator